MIFDFIDRIFSHLIENCADYRNAQRNVTYIFENQWETKQTQFKKYRNKYEKISQIIVANMNYRDIIKT